MKTAYGQLIFKRIIPILLGSAIYAFGIHYFVIPNELMEGGVTGISLLLKYVLNVPPSLTILAVNVPLFYIGWKILGRRSMYFTILGTVSLSFFLWIMEILIEHGWIVPFQSNQDDLLVTLYAGVTLGLGIGIVFRFEGTTGGVDIIARLGNKLRGWSMGQSILVIDTLVIGSSLLYITKEKVLYTLVLVFIATRVIDFVQKGAYAAKAFTIITDLPEQITEIIRKELDRGVTLFPAKGAYSRLHKNVLYCVVYRNETRRLITLVREIDPQAFIVIHDVQDVFGEGFRGVQEH